MVPPEVEAGFSRLALRLPLRAPPQHLQRHARTQSDAVVGQLRLGLLVLVGEDDDLIMAEMGEGVELHCGLWSRSVATLFAEAPGSPAH